MAAPVRYFLAVAEEGDIGRAALRLNVMRPESVLRPVSELESELGLKLLDHGTDGVRVTPAGDAFLVKARLAVAAYDEAVLMGDRLGRVARNELLIGFVGPPPASLAPELLGGFNDLYPGAEPVFNDLGFPRGSTSSWLGGTDVGLCFSPSPHPDVHLQSVREDARVVIAHPEHRLSARRELSVADVIDGTFVRFDPVVEPGWAGMLTLDDHRGEPAARVTGEAARSALEMLTTVASGQGIVVLAASHGTIIHGALPHLAVIPLRDAHPTALTLAWRSDTEHPLLDALVDCATGLA